MKLQYTLILLFTGLMAAILLGVNLVMYSMSSDYREHTFLLSLEDNSRIIANAVQDDERANDYLQFRNNSKLLPTSEANELKEHVLQVGKDTAGLSLPEALPLKRAFYQEAVEQGIARHYQDGIYYVALYQGNAGGDGTIVLSAARDDEGDHYRTRLKTTLAFAFIIALILMAITSLVFSYRLFGPVSKIIQKVNNIHPFNLNMRLDTGHELYELTALKDTLNDLLNRLEAGFKAQQDFVSNTSHSLRTPLTIIAGEAEIALTHVPQNHKAYYSLQMITQETEKLKHMISTLLELVKAGDNRQKKQWHKTRLDEMLNSVKRSVDKMDDSYTLKIDYSELPEDSSRLYVNCNEHLLSLAICNIILNGFKYSEDKVVTVILSSQPNTLSMQVIDNGIGIPASELDKIFTPYFRASNVENYEGFGIGLPLTMDIIRMHNGTIQVRSTEGKGTVMEIILPAVYTDAEQTTSA